jgi:hypothetical protein
MMNIVPLKTEEKKGLAWETRKALEVVPNCWGRNGDSVPRLSYADKFILMKLQFIISDVSGIAFPLDVQRHGQHRHGALLVSGPWLFLRTFSVGASMLAMDFRAPRGNRQPASSLATIATCYATT